MKNTQNEEALRAAQRSYGRLHRVRWFSFFRRFSGDGRLLLWALVVRAFEFIAGMFFVSFSVLWLFAGVADLKNGGTISVARHPVAFYTYCFFVLAIGALLIFSAFRKNTTTKSE